MKNILVLFLCGATTLAMAQTTTQNYVKTTTVRVVGKKKAAEVSALSNTQKNVSITYYDGLGRPMQQVQVAASANNKFDIITPITYDAIGREDKSHLPYVVPNCSTGVYQNNWATTQSDFYASTTTSDKIANTTVPFSEKVFEASPLNRVMEQGFADVVWRSSTKGGSGKTIKTDYLINTTNQVRQWNYNSSTRKVNTPRFYPAGELQYVQTTDENGNMVQEFSDKLGRMILKRVQDGVSTWADTYYVYDNFGNLVYVLPPQLLETIKTSIDGATDTHTISDTNLNNWAFQYKYDNRQRMISKKVPGAGWVEMVYDQWDRLVLTQDAQQKTKNEYIYTKYDALNRPILTGIWTDTTALAMLRTLAMAYMGRSENRTISGIGYTLNQSYPTTTTDDKVLTASYYDDYTLQMSWGDQYKFITELGHAGTAKNLSVNGQITGSQVRVLDGTTLGPLLKSVTYYDSKYRPIQTISEHIKTGRDRVSSTYDFVGQVKQTQRTHSVGNDSTKIKEGFGYDHTGRLKWHSHKINVQDSVILAYNNYNELGELVEKNLNHKTGNIALGSNYVQSVDYRYNIRGWLSHINNQTLTSQTGINDDTNDLFGMELFYNARPSGIDTTQFQKNYNGNITAVKWGVNNLGTKTYQGYSYAYDEMNRLENALHYTGTTTLAASGKYGEYGITYDKNGNISALKRRAANASNDVDNLVYTYTTGNQLSSVVDNATASYKGQLFVDGNINGPDYAYDGNGNMKTDLNKGISSITYNYLNLPLKVTKGATVVDYTYDATGQKLKKVAGISTTEYIGGIHYENNSLSFIQTAEGRIENNGGVWEYQYDLKDHLGNVRVSFRKSATGTAELLQKDDYYPFGLTFNSFSTSPENLYKFTGKEEQKETAWIDFGWRMYDPALGRWGVVDNLTEKYCSFSPYHYAGNNPIKNVDIDGNEFTDDAWKHVTGLIGAIDNKQAKNNSKINDKKSQIAGGGLSAKQEKRINRQISNLESNNKELEGVRGEIATLAASDQVYNVVESSSLNEPGTTVASTSFNFGTGNVDITISPGASLGLFAHELLHAYQFETGQASLGASGGSMGGSFLLDKTDEVAGYQRQGLFGSNEGVTSVSGLSERYKSLPSGPVSIHNYSFQGIMLKSMNQYEMKRLSKITKQAFRYDGKTIY